MLLLISLVLVLAPYLTGHDFDVIKVPHFSQATQRRMRLIGPISMLLIVLAHIPVIRTYGIRGTWEGTMWQIADSSGREALPLFDVSIVLTGYNEGEVCGSIEHESLECRGILYCEGREGDTYFMRQLIVAGRDSCLDGLNRLTLIDSSTLERAWIPPGTDREVAVGILKRVR